MSKPTKTTRQTSRKTITFTTTDPTTWNLEATPKTGNSITTSTRMPQQLSQEKRLQQEVIQQHGNEEKNNNNNKRFKAKNIQLKEKSPQHITRKITRATADKYMQLQQNNL